MSAKTSSPDTLPSPFVQDTILSILRRGGDAAYDCKFQRGQATWYGDSQNFDLCPFELPDITPLIVAGKVRTDAILWENGRPIQFTYALA